ncbi:unnamed protein product [Amoebophrya sp. A25]|nr:unnamed protein product [Amoebophrya sp. A25]|eukprot:GSA25T00026712001.1
MVDAAIKMEATEVTQQEASVGEDENQPAKASVIIGHSAATSSSNPNWDALASTSRGTGAGPRQSLRLASGGSRRTVLGKTKSGRAKGRRRESSLWRAAKAGSAILYLDAAHALHRDKKRERRSETLAQVFDSKAKTTTPAQQEPFGSAAELNRIAATYGSSRSASSNSDSTANVVESTAASASSGHDDTQKQGKPTDAAEVSHGVGDSGQEVSESALDADTRNLRSPDHNEAGVKAGNDAGNTNGNAGSKRAAQSVASTRSEAEVASHTSEESKSGARTGGKGYPKSEQKGEKALKAVGESGSLGSTDHVLLSQDTRGSGASTVRLDEAADLEVNAGNHVADEVTASHVETGSDSVDPRWRGIATTTVTATTLGSQMLRKVEPGTSSRESDSWVPAAGKKYPKSEQKGEKALKSVKASVPLGSADHVLLSENIIERGASTRFDEAPASLEANADRPAENHPTKGATSVAHDDAASLAETDSEDPRWHGIATTTATTTTLASQMLGKVEPGTSFGDTSEETTSEAPAAGNEYPKSQKKGEKALKSVKASGSLGAGRVLLSQDTGESGASTVRFDEAASLGSSANSPPERHMGNSAGSVADEATASLAETDSEGPTSWGGIATTTVTTTSLRHQMLRKVEPDTFPTERTPAPTAASWKDFALGLFHKVASLFWSSSPSADLSKETDNGRAVTGYTGSQMRHSSRLCCSCISMTFSGAMSWQKEWGIWTRDART